MSNEHEKDGIKMYRWWELLEKMPAGWKVDKTCGSPLCNYVFVTNGKSVVYGQKRALLRVNNEQIKSS